MTLSPGTRLGPYEIQSAIGEGGMGEVYKARDTRLDRSVAIKVLPPHVSSDPDRRARFEREAKAIAGLNHPHICTLHDVGEHPSTASGQPMLYLVMEHLQGETLAQRLAKGPLPPDQALRVATEIADALAAAHRQGVTHRDLKPGNVMLTPVGGVRHGSPQAKLLDFGLAKLTGHGELPAAAQLASAPTQATPLTAEGAIVGTLQYMAPEQVEGRQADARTDLWALGAILYEMLTGKRPFEGTSPASLIGAILEREPPALTTLQPLTPPGLDRLVRRCLAKDPDARWQSATDLADELRWSSTGSGSAPGLVGPTGARMARARRWPWIAAAAVLVAGAAGASWMLLRGGAAAEWDAFVGGRALARISSSQDRTADPELSRDGRMLSYVATVGGRTDVYVARVAGGARIKLTDDDAVEECPRFSPDGEFVAFARAAGAGAAPEVRIVPSLGGEVAAEIPGASFPAWSPDGRRLAYVRTSAGGHAELVVDAVERTAPKVILPADGVYLKLSGPAWSPDGRHVAVVRSSGGSAREIWLVPSSGGAARRVLDEPATTWSDSPVFTPDGRGIIHSSNRGGATNLWVAPLDGSLPVRLTTGSGPDLSPSVAADGSIAYLNSRSRNLLQVHDQVTGAVRTLLAYSPYLWGPAISPDGRDVAFTRSEEDGSWHIWSMPLAGGVPRRLTSGEGGEIYPRWSPDGAFVLFHTWNVPRRFGRVARDGGRAEWMSFGSGGHDGFADLSPDGRLVAFSRAEGEAERLYVAGVGGDLSRRLTPSPGAVPKWSPDGRRIAFSGSRSVSNGIFTIAADGTGERQLAQEGGWPVWWPDGKTIGYLAIDDKGNQQLRVIASGGGTPRPLGAIRLLGTNHPFAVAPDGRTIVITTAEHLADEIWLLKRERDK
jgi:eukaryotic-like serine/threonine-protein kinase